RPATPRNRPEPSKAGRLPAELASSLPSGVVVPTPTFPAASTRSASALFVLITSGCPSVVPRKFVPETVPVLPVRLQKLFVRLGRSPSGMLPTLQVFAPLLRRY